jgi:hypothetical protein
MKLGAWNEELREECPVAVERLSVDQELGRKI